MKYNYQKLNSLISSAGLSHADVAKSIGTTRQRVALWAAGVNNPNADAIGRLADFFSVSPAYFFDAAQQKRRKPKTN